MKRPKRKSGPNRLPVAILSVGAVGLLALFGYRLFADAQASNSMNKEPTAGCTHSPVHAAIDGMETVVCQSAGHVREGQPVQYDSDPPLAGDHWPSWVSPGFYKAAQPKERLVHSLEHGHIVIYYDAAKLSGAELDALKQLTATYSGQWDGVVAVPPGGGSGQGALILTAWEHGLRLEKWDQARINAFIDAFRGRGPENPVRPLQP